MKNVSQITYIEKRVSTSLRRLHVYDKQNMQINRPKSKINMQTTVVYHACLYSEENMKSHLIKKTQCTVKNV